MIRATSNLHKINTEKNRFQSFDELTEQKTTDKRKLNPRQGNDQKDKERLCRVCHLRHKQTQLAGLALSLTTTWFLRFLFPSPAT
jgi:hypothetical protein